MNSTVAEHREVVPVAGTQWIVEPCNVMYEVQVTFVNNEEPQNDGRGEAYTAKTFCGTAGTAGTDEYCRH